MLGEPCDHRVTLGRDRLKLCLELDRAGRRLGGGDLGLLELGFELGDALQSFRNSGLNLSGASLLRREQRGLELRRALLEGGLRLRRVLELALEHRNMGCRAGGGFGALLVTCL